MADTDKLTALQTLSNQLPVASQKIAAGQQAAQQMQLQNAIKAAPAGGAVTPEAQSIGASAAANTGANQVEAAKQNLAQQGQVGQIGLATENQANQAQVASQQQGAVQSQMDQAQQFAQLNEGLKKQLYDNNMQFQKDELGRTEFNEAQLADYARLKATSDEQLKDYQQSATQASQRRMQMVTKAHDLVMEDLQNKYAQAKQSGDQAAMREVKQQQIDNDNAMQREKNRDAASAAVWSAGGTLIGGAAGAMGGPAGAKAGAGLGSAVAGGLKSAF